jgi:NAD-dependent SIR2 family protein deacetylase
MNASYHAKIQHTREAIRKAETILIGGGAGLSTSAGLCYSGERFTSHFADFIERYGMTDMYSAGFYPFRTQEEKWAYWSRHIKVNRYDPGPSQVYCDLLRLVKGKSYFVITTNVDAQFDKAGFAREKIFAVQGDYGKLQCATACHQTLYANENMVRQMVSEQNDCRIPPHLIPKCPRCGGFMEPNLRKDHFFVEDDAWQLANGNYRQFIAALDSRPLVLLELGVGYNTPTIIKVPFEHITARQPKATLVRMNKDYPEVSPVNQAKTIAFDRDIGAVISAINNLAGEIIHKGQSF